MSKALAELMCDTFDTTELERFVSDLGIWRHLPKGSPLEMSLQSINYFDRRGELSTLLDALRAQRPGLAERITSFESLGRAASPRDTIPSREQRVTIRTLARGPSTVSAKHLVRALMSSCEANHLERSPHLNELEVVLDGHPLWELIAAVRPGFVAEVSRTCC
jgi:hypothetical protein